MSTIVTEEITFKSKGVDDVIDITQKIAGELGAWQQVEGAQGYTPICG